MDREIAKAKPNEAAVNLCFASSAGTLPREVLSQVPIEFKIVETQNGRESRVQFEEPKSKEDKNKLKFTVHLDRNEETQQTEVVKVNFNKNWHKCAEEAKKKKKSLFCRLTKKGGCLNPSSQKNGLEEENENDLNLVFKFSVEVPEKLEEKPEEKLQEPEVILQPIQEEQVAEEGHKCPVRHVCHPQCRGPCHQGQVVTKRCHPLCKKKHCVENPSLCPQWKTKGASKPAQASKAQSPKVRYVERMPQRTGAIRARNTQNVSENENVLKKSNESLMRLYSNVDGKDVYVTVNVEKQKIDVNKDVKQVTPDDTENADEALGELQSKTFKVGFHNEISIEIQLGKHKGLQRIKHKQIVEKETIKRETSIDTKTTFIHEGLVFIDEICHCKSTDHPEYVELVQSDIVSLYSTAEEESGSEISTCLYCGKFSLSTSKDPQRAAELEKRNISRISIDLGETDSDECVCVDCHICEREEMSIEEITKSAKAQEETEFCQCVTVLKETEKVFSGKQQQEEHTSMVVIVSDYVEEKQFQNCSIIEDIIYFGTIVYEGRIYFYEIEAYNIGNVKSEIIEENQYDDECPCRLFEMDIDISIQPKRINKVSDKSEKEDGGGIKNDFPEENVSLTDIIGGIQSKELAVSKKASDISLMLGTDSDGASSCCCEEAIENQVECCCINKECLGDKEICFLGPKEQHKENINKSIDVKKSNLKPVKTIPEAALPKKTDEENLKELKKTQHEDIGIVDEYPAFSKTGTKKDPLNKSSESVTSSKTGIVKQIVNKYEKNTSDNESMKSSKSKESLKRSDSQINIKEPDKETVRCNACGEIIPLKESIIKAMPRSHVNDKPDTSKEKNTEFVSIPNFEDGVIEVNHCSTCGDIIPLNEFKIKTTRKRYNNAVDLLGNILKNDEEISKLDTSFTNRDLIITDVNEKKSQADGGNFSKDNDKSINPDERCDIGTLQMILNLFKQFLSMFTKYKDEEKRNVNVDPVPETVNEGKHSSRAGDSVHKSPELSKMSNDNSRNSDDTSHIKVPNNSFSHESGAKETEDESQLVIKTLISKLEDISEVLSREYCSTCGASISLKSVESMISENYDPVIVHEIMDQWQKFILHRSEIKRESSTKVTSLPIKDIKKYDKYVVNDLDLPLEVNVVDDDKLFINVYDKHTDKGKSVWFGNFYDEEMTPLRDRIEEVRSQLEEARRQGLEIQRETVELNRAQWNSNKQLELTLLHTEVEIKVDSSPH